MLPLQMGRWGPQRGPSCWDGLRVTQHSLAGWGGDGQEAAVSGASVGEGLHQEGPRQWASAGQASVSLSTRL